MHRWMAYLAWRCNAFGTGYVYNTPTAEATVALKTYYNGNDFTVMATSDASADPRYHNTGVIAQVREWHPRQGMTVTSSW